MNSSDKFAAIAFGSMFACFAIVGAAIAFTHTPTSDATIQAIAATCKEHAMVARVLANGEVRCEKP